jgi:transcriptional regulator of NAD metabolism
LLFDGDTRADVPKFLEKVNRSNDIISENVPKVPVHVIHFFEEEFAKAMQRIAKDNLGTYRFIPKPTRDPPKSNPKG